MQYINISRKYLIVCLDCVEDFACSTERVLKGSGKIRIKNRCLKESRGRGVLASE
jgi:hypothetical protein